MKYSDAANEPPSEHTPIHQRAEAAALAAKVAALPEQRSAASPAERATSPQQPRRHGWLWWIIHLAICLGVIFLATVALLRIFFHDGANLLTCINAFTRYVYLPAYVALLWAAWHRRRILTFVSLAVIVCHLVWVAPNFLRDRRFELPPDLAADALAASPRLRIFFANVLGPNRNHEALLKEIAEADPDVIVLAEFAGHWHRAFQGSSFVAGYPYSTSRMWNWAGMVIIYSKLPLKHEMQNWLAGRQVLTVDLDTPEQPLRLIGLHAPRPMPDTGSDYDEFWDQMLMLLSVEAGPLVVVGDFNATEHSRVYQRLKALGLRSAHDDRGRGYATTWPNGSLPLPPIRIDQAFLSPEVQCDRIVEGRGIGSDHKPIIIDVRLRRPPQ